jgi:hypothetical protein
MAERRVTEIVRQRKGFGQIVIEAERAGNRASDLANFDRMGEARAIMIAFMRHENLCLMGKPAKSARMQNPVAVALKFRARRGNRFGKAPAAAFGRIGGIGRTDGRKSGTVPDGRAQG